MRYRVSAIVAATALAVLGYRGLGEPQEQVPKLAYINSNEIIAEAPGAAEAQATFEREMARWQSEIQAMSDSLDEMISAYEQQQVMLSPEKRQERQRTIELKRMEYQQRTLDLEQVAAQRQQELVQPIFDNIRRVLVSIRQERGYSMIFDAAGGALIDADTTLDITPLVIERLRADAGGGSSN
ncbi:MAG: OmpH family outer membrane protein [Gemmatimonadetes bacterium]|uniref:OmpH family outer membrane protein n=1 Tax=Candidatus Kutchimonas denitrificans TaxID=3056748 RepID=A0AAE5CD89_9BACT|nr:OmpH family outer membrane protein [Gemmatimonadota bacterium]NIR75284.1 OmpH family outer membrane protein [Candidatus Kutchimonas denitrificans]NIS00222.1 OmpH family outer membrane protein [Gemmatimonadota bacterium]NIT65814.1 OmpH family outer membrane protein [Gemmatimonadota bacterium]NIU53092.1 hypothetical protein [Gemmatimonadota bacterium]